MKRIFVVLLAVGFVVLSQGCKNDSTGSPTDGFGGGTGGTGNTGNVSATVAVVSDGTQYLFQLKPSTAVIITGATVKSGTAVNIAYGPANIPTSVFSATYPLLIPIQNNWPATTGTVYTFTLSGNVGSATGTAFTCTATYTVP